jgi:mono/diheme cytochrome c family protein
MGMSSIAEVPPAGWALVALCAFGTLIYAAGGEAASGDARRGETFAVRNCSGCHAVGRTGISRNPKAPTFAVVSRRYDPSDLEEAFAEGIVTGHPGMPEFTLEPRQIADLVAHLRRLRRVTQ